jgi:hypothetical protein
MYCGLYFFYADLYDLITFRLHAIADYYIFVLGCPLYMIGSSPSVLFSPKINGVAYFIQKGKCR